MKLLKSSGYLHYSGGPVETHNRFLRSLREDTLLKYRCRIVFTTRCRYENHSSMGLKELPAPELLANGVLKPEALLSKLESEKAAMNAQDRIGTAKDGRNSDYAAIQEAMDIYETLYAGQPDWIGEKRQKILETYGKAGSYLAKRIKGER